MSKRMLVTLAVVSLALLLAACGGSTPSQEPAAPTEAIQQEEEPAAQPPAADGAALLEERCTACHSLDRVTRAQKNHDGWTQTVTRMVGKGAQLSGDEQAALVDYLVETYGP